jgi:hypothetical protein
MHLRFCGAKGFGGNLLAFGIPNYLLNGGLFYAFGKFLFTRVLLYATLWLPGYKAVISSKKSRMLDLPKAKKVKN